MRTRTLATAVLATLGMLCIAADTQPAKTYKPDADGFIRNWVILDPISIAQGDHTEDVEKPVFAKEYFKDELKVQPKVGDKVTVTGAAKELVWREVKADDYSVDLNAFSADHNTETDNVLYWGVAYVVAADDIKDVKLAIGSDDSSLWWVNDAELVRVYDSRQVAQDDNTSKPITLNKGLNVVRVALIQGDGPSGLCARFLDAAGKPVKNVTIVTDPDAAPK